MRLEIDEKVCGLSKKSGNDASEKKIEELKGNRKVKKKCICDDLEIKKITLIKRKEAINVKT